MTDHYNPAQSLRGQIFEVIDAADGRYDHADADTITDAVMGVVTSDQERRRAYADRRVEWARRAEADTWQRRMREELEGRTAERDEEIAIRDARIAELFERLDRAHQTTRTALSDLRRARERITDLEERLTSSVTVRPGAAGGQACIGGTRIPAHIIAGLVPDVGEDGIADYYPSVTPAGARAAVAFFEQYTEIEDPQEWVDPVAEHEAEYLRAEAMNEHMNDHKYEEEP